MPGDFKTRYLVSGEVFVTSDPTLITTVLGSCIAVCLWDVKSGLGGMNHYVLPRWDGRKMASNRFGDVATRNLINRMVSLGASRENMKARVFGGASTLGLNPSALDAGRENATVALELLRHEGISVLETKVGGHKGRKLVFNTCNGNAIVHPVEQVLNRVLRKR